MKWLMSIFILLAICGWAQAGFRDSLNILTVGSWPYSGCPTVAETSINGHEYLLAGMGGGMFIFNVDTPSAPHKISEFPTTGLWVYQIKINGTRAYFVSLETGLWVVDISSPSNPQKLGHLATAGQATSVAVNENNAYVAVSDSGLLIVDVSDPSQPTVIGHIRNIGHVGGVAVQDTIVYIASFDAGLYIYNVVDPSNPSLVWTNYPSSVRDVDLNGRYIFLTRSFLNIEVLDGTDPFNPVTVDILNDGGERTNIRDTILLCATGSNTLHVCTIADSFDITLRSNYITSYYTHETAQQQQYAYIADVEDIEIIDLSDPANPQQAGKIYPLPTIYSRGFVKGSYAYMPSDAFHIIDVSDPAAPFEVSSYPNTSGGILGIWTNDTVAYFCDWRFGIKSIDVTDKANPSILDSLELPGGVKLCLQVKDSFAYVVCDTPGLYIVNIADPLNMAITGQYTLPANHSLANKSLDLAGQYAFVAFGSDGVRVIDISDPALPQEIGHYDTPGYASAMEVNGQFAYVADGDSGLLILDITAPSSPYMVGHFSLSSEWEATELTLRDNIAFVAYDSFGLVAINVSDPSNPYETGHYTLPYISYPSYPTGIAMDDSLLYVSYWAWGLQIFQYYGPSGTEAEPTVQNIKSPFKLTQNLPNPFNNKTTINYQLSQTQKVSLTVYNVAGQAVRILYEGIQKPGYHALAWDGRDGSGRAVSAGVYFLRLSSPDGQATKKMVVVK